MGFNYSTEFILIVFCMAIAAFLSGIETGVISICRVRLRHFVRQGDKASKILQGYLDEPDRLFGTTLVGTNICIVAVSVIAESMAADLPGPGWEVGASAVVTVLLLIFSEYLPKAWFHTKPFERCRRFAMELRLAEMALTPISGAILWITDRFLPGDEKVFTKKGPFVTRDELKVLVRNGERDGVLSTQERAMIHKVFELSGKRARDIMVPLQSITVARSDMTIDQFVELARSCRFTRMPVLDPKTQCFLGIANVFFAVTSIGEGKGKTVADFARKPLLIKEGTAIDDVLPLMRRAKQPMALVINDKSVVVGLVTDEDILEEVIAK